jgi:predicted O-linked N-acetylglucosamine transferase (SPINDLY family)
MIHELHLSTFSHALVSIENRINELNHHRHRHHLSEQEQEQEHHILGAPRKDDTFTGPFLPFDTLSIEINPIEKMIIAFAYSFNFNQNKRCTELDLIPDDVDAPIINNSTNNIITTTTKTKTKTTDSLRIGFLSFDINDHPTSHLIEGIFKVIENKRKNKDKLFENLYTVIFSYGKNDDSDYRKILQSSSDVFVDIVEKSHQASMAIIRGYKLDIILDMQMYTLGHRAEILARCVSPIQINYLVYPGSSGSSFLETIVVDKIVAPPEQAVYFTEKLLILPTSYQVSYYDRYLDLTDFDNFLKHNNWHDYKMQLRTAYGLPTNPTAIVFCNFNKLDKLEPQSFKVWMQILARVKYSYLWLLIPSQKKEKGKMVAENIKKYAFYFGVQQSRILFARRVSKSEHIIRHFAADLFLDNLVYGAHSTATDSLRGVLPILTLTGKEFPSRVATSLYDSMRAQHDSSGGAGEKDFVFDHMVCYSWKEFEDLAVSFFDLGFFYFVFFFLFFFFFFNIMIFTLNLVGN